MSDRETNVAIASTFIEVAKIMRKTVADTEPIVGYTPAQFDAWKAGADAMADFVHITGLSMIKQIAGGE